MDASTLHAPAPEAYRRLRAVVSFVVHRFFRRIEVVGLENVPAEGGGILVAWHPNGLVDPALILTAFPGHVVFGARSGLFRLPLLGSLIRSLGTVPIYRGSDADAGTQEERRQCNARSLDALADQLVGGRFSALFPEGFSHDEPFLQEMKTGAARLYYRARMRTPSFRPVPAVIPVGLHYDEKRLFRSAALVVFHSPLHLPAELDVTPDPDADVERVRELGRGLTDCIEAELRSVILETESWELRQLLHRARTLVRAERAARAGAEPGATSMDEKVVGMARIWRGYQAWRGTRPELVDGMRRRVHRYDARLRALGLEDHELDRLRPVAGFRPALRLLVALLLVFVVLPPFLLVGCVVNLPTAGLVWVLAHALGNEDKDVASLKLLGGIVLFPATWAAWAWVAAREADAVGSVLPGFPDSKVLAVLATLVLGVVGAVVMLRWAGLALGTLRALRVRLTRGVRTRTIERLRDERAELCDDLDALAEGLDLPGFVRPDGRVVREP